MITTVIQGPFHENCLDALQEYKKYGPVIISCYSTDDTSKVPTDVTLVKSVLPRVSWYNVNNVYYQSFSTYNGLIHADTEYVVKMRCNEKYSDISKFVDKVINNPKKIITNNVAFPRCSVQAFHPSDHMIGGKRVLLDAVFYDVKELCKKLPPYQTNIYGKELNVEWMGHLLPEQIICLCTLQYFGYHFMSEPSNPTTEQVREIMKQCYDVVPVEDLGEVTHSIFAEGERRFRQNGEGLYGYTHESIKSIDEV